MGFIIVIPFVPEDKKFKRLLQAGFGLTRRA